MSLNWRKMRRAGLLRGRAAAYRAQLLYRTFAPSPKVHTYGKFIISSNGRSGSTLLLQLCNSHPEVACFGELLHSERIYWHRRFMNPDAPGFLMERAQDPVAFLHRHLWHSRSSNTKAVGFKLLHDQLWSHRAELGPLIEETKGLKVIHLQRENGFDVYLSTKNFNRTNEAGQSYRLTGEIPSPLHVDLKECRQFLKRHELNDTLAKTIFGQHRNLSLSYDRLTSNPQIEHSKICAFLEVSDMPLRHTLKKLSRGPLSAKVANLDEVQRHFKGSKWESMFEND